MKKWLKISGYILISVAVLIILLVVFKSEIYTINRKPPLVQEHRRVLTNLSKEAVKKGDKPVSALLLYDFKIIGQGYNTVSSDQNPTGHAQINAINDAVKNLGFEKFISLKPDLLLLLTTHEPCEMCRGALKIYNIENVLFIQENPPLNSFDSFVKDLKYEFYKMKLDSEGFTDNISKMQQEIKIISSEE